MRLGSTNRLADAALIAELARRPGLASYDEQPFFDVDYEALDFAAAAECLSEVRSLRRQDLRSMGLVTGYQGRRVPTVGGFILFGRNRLERFPDAWIQAGRFAGKDRSNIADRAWPKGYGRADTMSPRTS